MDRRDHLDRRGDGGAGARDGPGRARVDDSFTFTNHFCGFPVQVNERAHGIWIQYFDSAGNPTHDVLLQTVTGTWTNPRSGEYLVENGLV